MAKKNKSTSNDDATPTPATVPGPKPGTPVTAPAVAAAPTQKNNPTKEPTMANTTPETKKPSTEVTTPAEAPLHTEHGTTTIADQVVAKIAGLAMSEVEGVYAVGGGFSRALGAAREAFGGGKDITRGVSVEVGKKQAACDLTLIVEYPHPIHKVAEQVRKVVLENIEKLVGLEVVEVNIDVTDVHVPGDDDKADNDEQNGAAPKHDVVVNEEPRVK